LSSKIFHQVHLHLGCLTKQVSGGAGHPQSQGVAGQGSHGVTQGAACEHELQGDEHGQAANDA